MKISKEIKDVFFGDEFSLSFLTAASKAYARGIEEMAKRFCENALTIGQNLELINEKQD
jgi:hypothetical protein